MDKEQLDKLEALARAAAEYGDTIGEDEWYSADENISVFVGNPDLGLIAACSPVAVLALIAQARAQQETAAAPSEEAARLRNVLVDVRHALQFANDNPGGGINGTLWMMHSPETLFDFTDAALAQQSSQPPAPVVAADDVIAAALAVVQDAIDGRRSEVHPCDRDNDDLAVRQCSSEIQALHAALKAARSAPPALMCPTCKGNDANAPCAYPGEGKPGCLRDARLSAAPEAAHADRVVFVNDGREPDWAGYAAAEAAHAQQDAAPAGWQLVPKDPKTGTMLHMAWLSLAGEDQPRCTDMCRIYEAMLAAAPAAVAPSDAKGKADAAIAGGLDSGCRMQGGICACRSGGSLGGCAKDRTDCCTNEPGQSPATSASCEKNAEACDE